METEGSTDIRIMPDTQIMETEAVGTLMVETGRE
jgi:hypothetical protein